MCGYEIADEDEDRHDDVFGDGYYIRARDFGDGDAAVSGVGGIEVDVVGADACCDCNLELLGFGETFGGEVAGVESGLLFREEWTGLGGEVRCGDDDLGVNELLVEFGVLAFFVGCSDESMSLIFEPFTDTEFILSCA